MAISFNPSVNLPINPQYYQPRQFFITDLVTGTTTLVTTNVNHDYVVGQLVRLIIPKPYGSWQLNGKQGYVIQVPAENQVVVDIYSVLANAFVANPSNTQYVKPQIIPIGDINSGSINKSGRVLNQTFINGSFINISPL